MECFCLHPAVERPVLPLFGAKQAWQNWGMFCHSLGEHSYLQSSCNIMYGTSASASDYLEQHDCSQKLEASVYSKIFTLSGKPEFGKKFLQQKNNRKI
jgi:hypothetical protein